VADLARQAGRGVIERLDHFMARANAAYYATHDPFADFTTSPEITQVFGEILGLWAAVTWRLLGSPAPVMLAEAGPGRGTLMRDALRAIAAVAPDFRAALSVHLVETSPRLRAAQAALLSDATWHDTIEGLPDGPLLLLANEFLDALPIRQFVRRGTGWCERHVAGGGFVEQAARLDTAGEEGAVAERCEAALAISAYLGCRFAHTPGAALFLDYGPAESAAGDSLQALRGGRPADPLADPGESDLTAHVDFAGLAAAAAQAGAAVHGPLAQGLFLARLGLFQRTDRLAQTQPPARAAGLIEAARRLAEPDRMGRLFKAMALCHPGCPTLPGFEAE
jgi:NADH dehydrogenase [ubiquinone] 1 alpha subcomplex assembly factor 7